MRKDGRVSGSASSIHNHFSLLTAHCKTVLRTETKPQNFPIPAKQIKGDMAELHRTKYTLNELKSPPNIPGLTTD